MDTLILGREHLYLSNLQPFASDPEGMLSTLPAVVTCLSGFWLAQWMSIQQVNLRFCLKLGVGGLLMVLLASALSALVPINKAMWTPTYVLLSSGFAILTVGLLSYLLEIKRYRLWSAPFLVFGVNSIAFFMFAGVLARFLIMIPVGQSTLKNWLYEVALLPMFGPLNGSLAFALLFLLVSYCVMYAMYIKGLIWKV
jgi:predicted acyltransferase